MEKKEYDHRIDCNTCATWNNFDIGMHVARKRLYGRRGADRISKTVERKTSEVNCVICPYYKENAYCDKIDGFVTNVTCWEVINIPRRIKRSNYRSRSKNKKERYLLGKYRLKRIVDSSVGWPPAATRRDKNRKYTEDPNETMYIKRYYRANHAPGYSGYLKKQSSRIIRRHKMELPTRGCGYRKYFDYWWELW